MGDIDQISQQLGELIASEREKNRHLEAIWKKLDLISKEQVETNGVAKEALRMAGENARKIREEIEPATDDYRTMKARGLGALGMAGLLGGGLSTAIAWALGYFKSGGS